MAYTTFRGMHPFAQFMFSLFVMVVCVLLFMFVSVLIAVPFFGLPEIMRSVGSTAMDTPESLNFLKYAQVVQSIGLFIVPPFILAWLFYGNMSEYLLIDRSSSFNNFLYTALSILLLIPLINFAGEINSKLTLPASLAGIEDWMRSMEEAAKVLTEKFLKVDSIPALLFNIFMVGVLPAIGEELLFRGVIQRIFINWTKSQHWGIWIAAILFSAFHLQFYGFLPRMLLGAMFGYLLVWTGSMWVPMLAHFINNTMGVIGYYMMDKAIISKDIEQWGTGSEQWPLVLFSIVSAGGMLYLIYRGSDQTKMPANQIDSQAPRID
ncbi:MAG: lysostaphin resistance A-like protein [Candidatus Saccharibacteria bacterium]